MITLESNRYKKLSSKDYFKIILKNLIVSKRPVSLKHNSPLENTKFNYETSVTTDCLCEIPEFVKLMKEGVLPECACSALGEEFNHAHYNKFVSYCMEELLRIRIIRKEATKHHKGVVLNCIVECVKSLSGIITPQADKKRIESNRSDGVMNYYLYDAFNSIISSRNEWQKAKDNGNKVYLSTAIICRGRLTLKTKDIDKFKSGNLIYYFNNRFEERRSYLQRLIDDCAKNKKEAQIILFNSKSIKQDVICIKPTYVYNFDEFILKLTNAENNYELLKILNTETVLFDYDGLEKQKTDIANRIVKIQHRSGVPLTAISSEDGLLTDKNTRTEWNISIDPISLIEKVSTRVRKIKGNDFESLIKKVKQYHCKENQLILASNSNSVNFLKYAICDSNPELNNHEFETSHCNY